MIEVRCQKCHKFLFEASPETVGTIVITCPRCKGEKNPEARRTIRLPFAGPPRREKAVALRSQEG